MMKRAAMVVALCLVAVTAWGETTVRQTDEGQWRIENSSLQVDLRADTGAMSVLDKRIDYRWSQPEGARVAPPTIGVPQAGQPPTVDGALGEWTGAPTFVLTGDMLADARQVDGAGDLSGEVWLAWDGERLYLAARVRDERAVWPAADEETWWERDSVEFWIGAEQYALIMGPERSYVWRGGGELEGAQVAMKTTADGYSVEASAPLTAKAGDAIRFALGVNDADNDGGRQGQLYFPTTWSHSNPSSFAKAVLLAQGATVPEQTDETTSAWRNVHAVEEGVSYETELGQRGGESLAATVTVTVPDGRADLIITVDAPADAQVGDFEVTAPFVMPDPAAEVVAARYANGVAIPVTDMSWKGRRVFTDASLDMPWVGLTNGAQGYMLLWETPDDGVAVLEACGVGDETVLAPAAHHLGSRGTFAHSRTVRYSFTDDGGHVAICKLYREYAREHGFLVTLREKAEQVPAVARLMGAPDVWGASSGWALEAHEAGIDRCLVNGRWPAETMQRIIDLGYLVSEYDNYVDLLEGERGDNGTYGPLAEDVRMHANGEMVKGWLTWDKKRQYYKRCSATAVAAAEREIVPLLAKYPYNARFLDVTTASGLRECHHPNHPQSHTEDREANVALAEYVKSHGLVLGGEHGRWWGAHVFDYWEGMQSGGNYSWPAGHVGIDIPETREDIGERYWTWGIGHERRVPLWELVFGDCVVSTWYWGDSTGHLWQAAPELTDKKDAFNILYGTVPLYWVSRPYGLNWNTHRERLLESYRNVCKLHEQTGWEEMLSHEFVTDDRAVQRTRFASGITVTVNFGEEPYAVESESGTHRLATNGFLAEGPETLLYKALDGAREVTFIRTPGYLFCDGGGTRHDFGTVITSGQFEMRGLGGGTDTLTIRCTDASVALDPARLERSMPAKAAALRLFTLNAEGERTGYQRLRIEGGKLIIDPSRTRQELAWGRAIAAPDLEITDRSIEVPGGAVRQGEPLVVNVRVRNRGGAPARDATIVLRTGELELGRQMVTVSPLGTATVRFEADTTMLDGTRTFTVTAVGRQDEPIALNNEAIAVVFIEPNLSLWRGRRAATVTNDDLERTDAVVSAEVDFGAAGVDPASVRVVEEVGGEVRSMVTQFEAGEGNAGTVLWIMPGVTKPGQQRGFTILSEAADVAGRHIAPDATMWDDEALAATTSRYRAELEEGAIGAVSDLLGAARRTAITGIMVSSGETGWTHEIGDVTDLRVLARGPVRAVVEVDKTLKGDRKYTKRYEFYSGYFVIRTTTDTGIGSLTRTWYGTACAFEDETGATAQIDGKGDGEGIIGRGVTPNWFAAYTDEWAHSCVNLREDIGGITYWDAGAWGGVSLNVGGSKIGEVAYVFHGGQPDASFAERDFRLMRSAPTVTLE